MGELALSREQRPAADITRSVVVSAGAGSGKTRVLTVRYLKLIAAGVSPAAVVAMTFSRKAAAELRQRVDRALSRAYQSGLLDGESLDEAARRRLFAARTRLGEGHIGTIHSFCQGVLTAEPTLIPDRPGFTVLDQTSLDSLLGEALARAAGSSDPLAGTLARLRAAGLPRYRIDKATRELLPRRWEIDEVRRTRRRGDAELAELVAQSRREMAEEFFALLETTPEEIGDRLDELAADAEVTERLGGKELDGCNALELFHELRRILLELSRGPGGFADLDADDLTLLRTVKSPSGVTKSHLHGWNVFSLVKNAVKTFESCLGVDLYGLERRAAELTDVFLDWLDEVDDEFRRLKVRRRGADYQDLLELTAAGLTEDGDLVRGLRGRYRHFLIDEFQDTDPRQWEIIRALALPPDEGRTLFIVGDRKQSIYGFRGGDNTVFRRAAAEVRAAGGAVLSLDDNYRSAPAVLDFVNPLFEELFGADKALLAADPENSTAVEPQAMNHRRAVEGSGGVVFLQPAEVKDRLLDKLDEALLCGRGLVELLEGRLAGIPAPANHPDEWVRRGERPLVGVLGRTREKLSLIAAALDHLGRGSDYALLRGGGLFAGAEADWLRAALGALVDPRDGVQLAALALSPLGGLDYDDLLRLRRRADELGRPWSALLWGSADGAVAGLGRRIELLRGRLRRWRRSAGLTSGSRLIAELYRESAVGSALRRVGQPDRWRRLEHLLELVRAQERLGVLGGPLDTLTWLRDNEDSRDIEEPLDAGEPIVLLTIHAAKGLEFPVVLLPFLDAKTSAPSWDHVLARDRNGRRRLRLPVRAEEPPYSATLTPLSRELRNRVELRETLEAKRLFYVACTRAEDHLILVRGDKKEKPNLRGEECGKQPLRWINARVGFADGEARLKGDLVGRVWTPADEITSIQNDTASAAAAVDTSLTAPLSVPDPLPVGPSVLGELRRCPRLFYLRRVLKLSSPPRRRAEPGEAWTEDGGGRGGGRGGAFGGALHHLISLSDGRPLPAPELENLLADYVHSVAEDTDDPESAAWLGQPGAAVRETLTGHLTRLDGMESWRRIRDAAPRYEVPLRVEVDGCLVMGYIDCLTTETAELGIYDFKSTVVDRPLGELGAHHGYDLQLGVYALAAGRLFSTPVTELGLLYTAPEGGYQPLEVDAAAESAHEALGRAASLARTPFAEVPRGAEEACRDCPFVRLCFGLDGGLNDLSTE